MHGGKLLVSLHRSRMDSKASVPAAAPRGRPRYANSPYGQPLCRVWGHTRGQANLAPLPGKRESSSHPTAVPVQGLPAVISLKKKASTTTFRGTARTRPNDCVQQVAEWSPTSYLPHRPHLPKLTMWRGSRTRQPHIATACKAAPPLTTPYQRRNG